MEVMPDKRAAAQQVNRMEIMPDKRFLAAAGNPHIRLFQIDSNQPQPVMSYDGHTNNVTAVGFQCDGRWMYSGSEDGTVKIWDLRAPPLYQRDYESRAAVNTVVLHPNQTELISGDQNGNIRVWDLTANACSCELVPEVDTAIRSVAVMWDGSMVVAANNKGTCFVWRLTSGSQTAASFEPLHKLQAHNSYVLKCLLSPEFSDPNRYLATASADGTVKIWNADGFTLERTLTGHARWVWDCVFSIDGAYLVSGLVAPLLSLAPTFTSAASSDSTSRLWALASGNSPLPFCTRCTSAASSDGTSRLWELASGNCVRVYQGHQKAVVCCALNDGTDLPPA
ncbi:unnamed protein product [Closterium sp. NIES-65]|nr:unnamed protein product [Closterium sp. NIES-65]